MGGEKQGGIGRKWEGNARRGGPDEKRASPCVAPRQTVSYSNAATGYISFLIRRFEGAQISQSQTFPRLLSAPLNCRFVQSALFAWHWHNTYLALLPSLLCSGMLGLELRSFAALPSVFCFQVSCRIATICFALPCFFQI